MCIRDRIICVLYELVLLQNVFIHSDNTSGHQLKSTVSHQNVNGRFLGHSLQSLKQWEVNLKFYLTVCHKYILFFAKYVMKYIHSLYMFAVNWLYILKNIYLYTFGSMLRKLSFNVWYMYAVLEKKYKQNWIYDRMQKRSDYFLIKHVLCFK